MIANKLNQFLAQLQLHLDVAEQSSEFELTLSIASYKPLSKMPKSG